MENIQHLTLVVLPGILSIVKMYFSFCIALALVATCYAGPATNSLSNVCKSKNGYYSVEGSCDSYIRCNDYVPVHQTCPDGLHYNPDAKYPNYPCGYPSDVLCLGRGSVQPAQPTEECPHQYGYFSSPYAAPDNCGHYRVCIEGRAIDMHCPTGLAFNADSGRCDWPHLVPSCKSGDYLGFSCPAGVNDDDGKIRNYKYPGNCYYFFSCLHGHVRLLSCNEGAAFDPVSGLCVDEVLVNCAQY
ncbi:unnamed protein product [Arctia plantaginis]|uniref:Chitin-binding type-2 domain-containing protein n=1 Tax=Arctia plantaginis TaxID=874455 RepID=A0A8S0ZY79_ARCPL|nr:unnamed protein product [Arctia plantaginis]CAB3238665.1 unnamed protein product [Arctia plantaginis]